MTHICPDYEFAVALAFSLVRGNKDKHVGLIKRRGRWTVKEIQ